VFQNLTESNHELDDLKTGDPFLPPDSDSPRALEIIPVHDNVNKEVEGDHGPMIPMSSQSIGCSRGERLRRGGRCAGKLQKD
jgi:hypothetical protein